MAYTVTFWGTRGSIPTPGPATSRYGGNTPCVAVEGTGGQLVVLDAGTGIRALGRPSARMPVPASRTTNCPPVPSTATQGVLPPYRDVAGPGVGMLPRVPQKVTV